jgi:hypothetical protein
MTCPVAGRRGAGDIAVAVDWGTWRGIDIPVVNAQLHDGSECTECIIMGYMLPELGSQYIGQAKTRGFVHIRCSSGVSALLDRTIVGAGWPGVSSRYWGDGERAC